MKGKKYIIEHNFSYGWEILNEFVQDDCTILKVRLKKPSMN